MEEFDVLKEYLQNKFGRDRRRSSHCANFHGILENQEIRVVWQGTLMKLILDQYKCINTVNT